MANAERFQPSPATCFGSSDNHSLILFRKIKEGFDCKVNVQTFRAALRQSLGGSYGQRGDHKHRVFSSRGSSCWQFLIGLYVLGCATEIALNEEYNFNGVHENLLPIQAALIALLNLSIIHWSLRKTSGPQRILREAADLYTQPVQCPRKECQLRFQQNSTATSDGGAQTLGNDLCHASRPSAPVHTRKAAYRLLACRTTLSLNACWSMRVSVNRFSIPLNTFSIPPNLLTRPPPLLPPLT